jgi:hypothetical protein
MSVGNKPGRCAQHQRPYHDGKKPGAFGKPDPYHYYEHISEGREPEEIVKQVCIHPPDAIGAQKIIYADNAFIYRMNSRCSRPVCNSGKQDDYQRKQCENCGRVGKFVAYYFNIVE